MRAAVRVDRYLVLTVVLAATLATTAPARAGEPVVVGERLSVRSEILGEERPVQVYLPPGYAGSAARYPVVYVLDGEGRFVHTVGTVQTLVNAGHIPDLIVVGIVNTDRTRDLTPAWTRPDPVEYYAQAVQQGGGADAFLRVLREELIPWVDRTYRTAPYRILIGHSFGGLFALHAFFQAPGVFGATVAVSPSVAWDDGLMVERSSEFFAAHPDLRARLFLTMADEGGGMLENFKALEERLRYAAPPGVEWEGRVLDGEDHSSVVVPSVHYALKAIYPRWPVPGFVAAQGLPAIDRHYATLAADYGYPVATPEGLINNLGYQVLGRGEPAAAIELLSENVRRFPGSANVYDSLGEALEAAGRLAEAREQYARAVERGGEIGDPNLAAYQGHLDAVAAKLTAGR